MYDLEKLNEGQRRAVVTTDGPVLITAGPGTGKTLTLVQRAIYLIQEKGVRPEEIMMATFTEKAAKELVTRITNELTERGISVNLNEMYVGTFHSLCLRIINENMEYARVKKNYRMLDEFEQQYIVHENLWRFYNDQIPGFKKVIKNDEECTPWEVAHRVCTISNNLSEELIDPNDLKADEDPNIATVGSIMEVYQKILDEENLIDFSGMQIEAYNLLKEHPDVLGEIREKIRYIMVDEYQDTNYIQEQIVFLLGEEHKNICVVGDDDQGLYRFRGATIRNILEFPSRFEDGECKIIPLVENYRSNSKIVEFYNKWMQATKGSGFEFQWGEYRYDKSIIPTRESQLPAVVKLSAENDRFRWYEKILDFIQRLKNEGKISDYNQIAFLFNSVKNPQAVGLADYLENNGISVYSPRSNMFFERKEVKLMLGCLMLLFPTYVSGLENIKYTYLPGDKYIKYNSWIDTAREFLKDPQNAEFQKWVQNQGKIHCELEKPTDYAYTGLIYRMFEFPPFSDYLDSDLHAGVADIRPVRNIALLTKIIRQFEDIYGIDVLNPAKNKKDQRYIDYNTEILFNRYLRLRCDEGITEYEDDSEYAPSGCVSFLTIHQSKGMEFPVVIVDSIGNRPFKSSFDLLEKIPDKYYHRPQFEPVEQIMYFDFWRKYYTAFSRAQDLLVLTCNEYYKDDDKCAPSKYFRELYRHLESADDPSFDISGFEFQSVKDVNLKESFSFTSHIAVFELCALQYKFYRELGFAHVRVAPMLFGSVVHQTIEDIHRAALRHEEAQITKENIEEWFDINYNTLSKSAHAYLKQDVKEAALKHVQRYAEKHAETWNTVKEAECDVSLVKSDYILEGKIDLIRDSGDTVEIVDFKSEKKPKDAQHLERYRRQLQVYAHLVQERTGQKVSNMRLYYTGEEGEDPTVSFPYQETAVEKTIQEFDDTVHKILEKDFSCRSTSKDICNNCDFRYFCKKRYQM